MAQIIEDYVSFETAKLLKKKGFDVPITSVWIDHFKMVGCPAAISIYPNKENWNGTTGTLKDINTSAPTLQMAMRWLREEKDIFIMIKPYPNEDGFAYAYEIKRLIGGNDFTTRSVRPENNRAGYDSYEDACEAAIKYCLENLI